MLVKQAPGRSLAQRLFFCRISHCNAACPQGRPADTRRAPPDGISGTGRRESPLRFHQRFIQFRAADHVAGCCDASNRTCISSQSQQNGHHSWHTRTKVGVAKLPVCRPFRTTIAGPPNRWQPAQCRAADLDARPVRGTGPVRRRHHGRGDVASFLSSGAPLPPPAPERTPACSPKPPAPHAMHGSFATTTAVLPPSGRLRRPTRGIARRNRPRTAFTFL